MQELKDMVFESPVDRAPGPYGFSGGFFKTSWNIIKEDLIRALNKFYDLNEPSFNSLNTAFFILLPKKEAPSQISHYRPISLIHAFAKLVSKILGQGCNLGWMSLCRHVKVHLSLEEASRIIFCMSRTLPSITTRPKRVLCC
jgi:hypothetical protein